MKSNEIFAEFKVTADATYVWLIDRSDGGNSRIRAFYKVFKTREWFRSEINELRPAIMTALQGVDRLQPAESIFDALFPSEYASIVLQAKNIVFVPDDVLFLIPFEVLSPNASKGVFPLVGIPTRYYPSAAVLTMAEDTESAREWPEAFLGVGDPITSSSDDRYSLVNALARSGVTRTGNRVEDASHANPRNDQLGRLKSRGLSLERLRESPITNSSAFDVWGSWSTILRLGSSLPRLTPSKQTKGLNLPRSSNGLPEFLH